MSLYRLFVGQSCFLSNKYSKITAQRRRHCMVLLTCKTSLSASVTCRSRWTTQLQLCLRMLFLQLGKMSFSVILCQFYPHLKPPQVDGFIFVSMLFSTKRKTSYSTILAVELTSLWWKCKSGGDSSISWKNQTSLKVAFKLTKVQVSDQHIGCWIRLVYKYWIHSDQIQGTCILTNKSNLTGPFHIRLCDRV